MEKPDDEELHIQEHIDTLIRKSDGDIKTFVTEIKINHKVDDTQTTSHCYILNLDGNGTPRTKDFAQFVAGHVVDYSIPRKEIALANKVEKENNTKTASSRLDKKARKLFTSLKKSGEGGEMLLYILVQEFLKLPQLICKMPLKTNADLHYNGADGIHVSAETDSNGEDILCLYWGESKLHANVSTAIKDCVQSIKDFLLTTGGSSGRTERDLQLIQDGILTLNNEKLENLLLRYFDKNDPKSNRVKFKGVCLVGFNSKHYPESTNKETLEGIKIKIEAEIDDWIKKLKTNILKHQNLETFEIHIFLLPFPNVQEFRDSFWKEISS